MPSPSGHKSAWALACFYETLSSFVLTKKYGSAYISTGCALKVVKFIFKKVVICTEILLVLPFASSERYIYSIPEKRCSFLYLQYIVILSPENPL